MISQKKSKISKIISCASLFTLYPLVILPSLSNCTKPPISNNLDFFLDPSGKITNNLTYKDAIKIALSNQSSYTKFKEIFANEIILKWYEDRATNNELFKLNLAQWKQEIDDEYDKLVQNQKDVHNNNWQFYFQNDYLSPNGGTQQSYKHKKLLEKVREEFIKNVWKNNYFSMKTNDKDKYLYPYIFSNVNYTINKNTLDNPNNWSNLGFYASGKNGFWPNLDDHNYLAKHQDGDYATIQQYVFDRWFATEKPFFVDLVSFNYFKSTKGSLIKYNQQNNSKDLKPCEEYPEFGNFHDFNDFESPTFYYERFMDNYQKNNYLTSYEDKGSLHLSNGTYTFNAKNITQAKNKKTLFFVCGAKMYDEKENSFSLPQKLAIGASYHDLLSDGSKLACCNNFYQDNVCNLTLSKYGEAKCGNLLKAFMLPHTDDHDYINLCSQLYGIDKNFPLFSKVNNTIKSYAIPKSANYDESFFSNYENFDKYLNNNISKEAKNDLYFSCGKAINAFSVDFTNTISNEEKITQELIYGLDKEGAFILTIDGYPYIKNKSSMQNKLETMKNVFKYRLMQDQLNHLGSFASLPHILGSGGKLEEYFKENFNNIILEMALSNLINKKETKFNIFKSYKYFTHKPQENDLFFVKIVNNQKLGNLTDVYLYIINTIKYDVYKNDLQNYVLANNKIYDYNNQFAQLAKLQNKTTLGMKAPCPYYFKQNDDEVNCHYDYFYNLKPIISLSSGLFIWDLQNKSNFEKQLSHKILYEYLQEIIKSIDSLTKANNINKNFGFSPQIKEAKQEKSDRFWLKSLIADSALYQMISSSTDNQVINAIKINAFKQYLNDFVNKHNQLYDHLLNYEEKSKSILAIFLKQKLASLSFNKYANTNDYFSDLTNMIENHFLQNSSLTFNSNDHEKNNFELMTLLATIAYLVENNYEHFYQILNEKILKDEKAYLTYTNKFSCNNIDHIDDKFKTIYQWDSSIDGEFGCEQFYGQKDDSVSKSSINTNELVKISSPFSQNVIQKKIEDELLNIVGFAGLITENDSKIDLELKNKLFKKLPSHLSNQECYHYKSSNSNNLVSKIKNSMNYGVFFAFAGYHDDSGQVIKINSMKDISSSIKKKISQLIKNKSPKLKLINQIACSDSINDLQILAKTLNSLYIGDQLFSNLSNLWLNDLKNLMIKKILELDDHCFERLVNTRMINGESNKENNYFFALDGKNEFYQFMVTQINKEDLVTKSLTPKIDHDEWIHGDAQIDPEEFFYLLVEMAMDPQVQKRAEHNLVKKLYDKKKLIVYDQNIIDNLGLYWIKSQHKK